MDCYEEANYDDCDEISNDLIFSPRRGIVPKSKKGKSGSTKRTRKKTIDLESLPSPRAMYELPTPTEDNDAPEDIDDDDDGDDPHKVLISISELNPFFEELELSSANSSEDESPENTGQVESASNSPPQRSKVKAKRSSSFRGILSSIGRSPAASNVKSQDQESVSSSSGQLPDSEKEKTTLRKKLKNVSTKVKKQFFGSGGMLPERAQPVSDHGGGGDNGDMEFDKDDSEDNEFRDSSPQVPRNVNKEESTRKETKWESHGNANGSRDDISYCRIENRKEYSCNLLWSLPNWVDNAMSNKTEANVLEELMEAEKRRIAQKQPMDWAEAVNYLRRSVGRDFRRGYLALGEKMQLPNMQAIRCLKFNPLHSFLSIGCENGTLVVLELDYQKPLQSCLPAAKSDRSFQNLLYHLPIGSKCRVRMNETLVGHTYDLRCLAWNNVNGKLLSSDELGVIIGWGFGENGCWVEEIINDRSTSLIRDIAWSPNGTKVAIGYEDYTEDGSITGGLLVGLADGTPVFDRKFRDSQVNCVVWYSDEIIWTVVNCILYSFDGKGKVGKFYRQLSRNSETTEMTSFLLKPKSSWVTSENAPEFAVVFKDSCLALFNAIEDKSPVRIHTKLTTNCADWCANGLYIAVGGMSLGTEEVKSTPRINLYNFEGNLLQIIKIPGKTITNVCWDPDSLHLAVSTQRSIYFANLRPMYKVSSNGKVHCYAYTTDGITQLVNFWNGKARFTQSIPGKVIDIKCFADKFGLLCMDSLGVYHVFVFGETGVNQYHLCITTMEPFAITMTKNSIVCLAPNAILNWNYNLGNGSGENSKKFTGALKKTRQVHVDDYPAIIAKPGERNNHLSRPTVNAARCVHALRDQLCIARESGRLQLYALPTLGFLQAYQLNLSDGDICQQLSFNNEGTRIALLTMNGDLKFFMFPDACTQGTEIVDCVGCSNVSDLLWASDMPNFLCVLEGNDIHIIKDDEKIETISKIPPGSYLTKFESLEITVIDMEEVIENPDQPVFNLIMKLRTPTLAKLETDVVNQEAIEDILKVLDSSSYNHTILRRLVADEALRQGEYTLAEHIYSYDQNYMAVEFLGRIRDVEVPELKRAESFCFIGDYEQAQNYFLRAERKDLAIKMWKDLGDWEKVNCLKASFTEDSNLEALDSQFEECVEDDDWESAHELALNSENAEEIMRCCIMLEDHEKLIDLAQRLPVRDPLLKKIGEILACDGVAEQAAKCFVNYGDPASAMKVAVDTRQWDLAMSLSNQYNLPLITPSLVVHVKSLIAANNLNPAIQILERCGKITTAGKLLVWKGLCMLQNDHANTMAIKKIFVLAAHTLSKRKNRVKKNSMTCIGKPNLADSQELDLECLIPEKQLRIMNGHNEWCWSDPWRGAEAIHFLNLCQRFIHRNMTGRAFKAAMHLRTFEDIIGSNRINSFVALTAIKEGNLRTASNALLKLEAEDENYCSISFHLFKKDPPQDRSVKKVQCPGCQKSIPDFHSACPFCNTKLFICMFSACRIMQENEMWTCEVCSRHAEMTRRDRFDYCLLCHSEPK